MDPLADFADVLHLLDNLVPAADVTEPVRRSSRTTRSPRKEWPTPRPSARPRPVQQYRQIVEQLQPAPVTTPPAKRRRKVVAQLEPKTEVRQTSDQELLDLFDPGTGPAPPTVIAPVSEYVDLFCYEPPLKKTVSFGKLPDDVPEYIRGSKRKTKLLWNLMTRVTTIVGDLACISAAAEGEVRMLPVAVGVEWEREF